MHQTLHPSIIGRVDSNTVLLDSIQIKGWCLTREGKENKRMRIKTGDALLFDYENKGFKTVRRDDVSRFYNVENSSMCGWTLTLPLSRFPCDLQMELADEVWVTVFAFPAAPSFALTPAVPSYSVVDNFYADPDAVRRFALSCKYDPHPANHKGKRTDQCYRFAGLKERFEQIIGSKIKNWDTYGTNGCFQYCIGGDQLVYHCDAQQYAGVLFLTPDAPVDTGTCLLRSIHTKKMKVAKEEHDVVFRNGFLDPTEFEVVDVVGNIYNRLVLFDSRHIHAATNYFGTTKENGRLFQLFFFDLE